MKPETIITIKVQAEAHPEYGSVTGTFQAPVEDGESFRDAIQKIMDSNCSFFPDNGEDFQIERAIMGPK